MVWWWRPILKSWYETKLLLTKSRTRAARTHRSEGGRRRRRSERLYITSAYRAHDNDQEIDSLAKSKMLTQRARFIIMHMALDMVFPLGGVRIYRGKWGRGRWSIISMEWINARCGTCAAFSHVYATAVVVTPGRLWCSSRRIAQMVNTQVCGVD